ncbi:MAG TPA: CRISPR-associated endonuclease Cas3'' [Synergistaceae bacterium]|nr:CRISPR-associated endonuclease Cas3'' [Synergistaceae bacterium]
MEYIAHVRKREDGSWDDPQLLKDHLEGTATLAAEFAAAFGNEDWGKLLGLWHDLGKYVPWWQKNRIRKSSGYDTEAHIETENDSVNHSEAGAVWAFKLAEEGKMHPFLARALSYAIAGHHAGLPDWFQYGEDCAPGKPLPNRVYQNPEDRKLYMKDLDQILCIQEASPFLRSSHRLSTPLGVKPPCTITPETFHLWIRMLYSSLVDADFLDTEKYMNPEKPILRSGYDSLESLKVRFDAFMNEKTASAPDTPVNKYRNEILQTCREKAFLEPGFFTLTVPTGGGKTLSSMAFALTHALKHGQKRIIYAIPYTSIIEQNAKVFKYGTDDDEKIKNLPCDKILFGERNVIEHHSNLDPEKENSRNRLASENWDAPIIVTTNVQLFESLFASKSSRCRKLHNIAHSVIILDEAQMLPPEHLKPILSTLKNLVRHLGVTLVFCTATQPALTGKIGSGEAVFSGIENCTEIVDDPEDLAKNLERITFSFPQKPWTPRTWQELAEELALHKQVLCVVNTRKSCRELHKLMPEGTIHLSAFMCPEERSEVVSRIKKDLREGKPIRVVSTQLVEAGVDIDFPIVYRALAGMDSIAQAGGRCNREGSLHGKGKVVIFLPPDPSPKGFLLQGENTAKEMLQTRDMKTLKPNDFTDYFRLFYAKTHTFDTADFQRHLLDNAGEFQFQFRTFDKNFKLIDNTAYQSIIVRYEGEQKNSSKLIEQLRYAGPSRNLLRKLQRFSVSVPAHALEPLRQKGMIEEIQGYLVQTSPELYKPGLGLILDEKEWGKTFLLA